MSDAETNDETDGQDVLKWVAVIAAIVLAVPLLAIAFPIVIVLIAEAPWLLALFGVMTFAFLAWAGIRTGVLTSADRDEPAEVDPLTTLQDRYAAGELSETEFERRLESILQSDEAVRRAATGSERFDEPRVERGEREPSTEQE